MSIMGILRALSDIVEPCDFDFGVSDQAPTLTLAPILLSVIYHIS